MATDDNEVFTVGSRSWYMPDNHSDEEDDSNTVVHWKELSNKMVCEVACGSDFAAALTSVGLVYTWGTGIYGQLVCYLMSKFVNFLYVILKRNSL